MKLTNLLRMKLPEGKDPVNVEDFNDNFKAIDKELEQMQTSDGDASKNTVTFSTAAERTNVASTETLGTLMGKIAKWFTDMKAAAFAGIANNETTNTDGFVLDARIGKKHSDQLNGLYFGTDAKGKWGFKTSQGGTVTPFRNPTGNAAAANVLSGKVFSSAELEDATGSMPNNGAWVGETTGNGNVAIPAGYHSGDGYVSGAGAYNKGVSDADGRVNTECASYKSGYAKGRERVSTEEKTYSWSRNGDMGNYGGFNATLVFSGKVLGIASIARPSNCSFFSTRYGTSAFPVKINENVVNVGWTAYGTMEAGTITVTALVFK